MASVKEFAAGAPSTTAPIGTACRVPATAFQAAKVTATPTRASPVPRTEVTSVGPSGAPPNQSGSLR